MEQINYLKTLEKLTTIKYLKRILQTSCKPYLITNIMHDIKRVTFFSLFLSVFFINCSHTNRKIENLHTFAKVYGYVRWFYPGDEAAKIDWNKFAVYGVKRVENAGNKNELKQILIELFKPIAPAIQITDKKQDASFELKSITPNDTSGLNKISWVHYGVYLGKQSNIYKSLRYNRNTVTDFDNRFLKIGEFIKKDIGSNLVIIMPLALYGSNEHTFPVSDTLALKQLHLYLGQIPSETLNNNNNTNKLPKAISDILSLKQLHLIPVQIPSETDNTTKLANVVIAWNVFQHFYPYFDVVGVDWEEELSKTLHNVYAGKTEPDYFKTLSKMVAKLKDGHGVVYTNEIKQWGLPIKVGWIQNNVVVLASLDTTQFRIGDIVNSIDGRSALEELQEQESLISGSSQLKRNRALNMFGSDFLHSEANVIVIRNNKKVKIKATRQTGCSLASHSLFGGLSSNFIDYGDSTYYLNKYPIDTKKVMTKLVNAKGLIINFLDFNDEYELISHIIKEPVWSPKWNIPVNIYPDRMNTIFDTSKRWKIEPKEPFIKAKLIFLTHPYNVSSNETLLGIVDYYKLGKFVGDTTAATNGNANYINLMGGYNIMWTGMKVLKHDGSQHHLIGFRPDYPVKRTIEAIKEGRDEYIEKAKKILKEEVENPNKSRQY